MKSTTHFILNDEEYKAREPFQLHEYYHEVDDQKIFRIFDQTTNGQCKSN